MNKMVVYVLLVIFAFVLFSNAVVSKMIYNAYEIPYQVNHSDRIIIGTVKELLPSPEFTDAIISVDEWLKNPLSRNEIIVRTEWGTNAIAEDATNFSVGERTLLMLKDVDIEKGRFSMPFMGLGKRSVSDRDAVVKEIAALPKSTSSVATAQTPGFEAVSAVGLFLSFTIYMMKRRNEHG